MIIAELRGGFLLFVALTFFVIIIAFFAVGMVMRPNRWSERTRLTREAHSSAGTGFSTTA
jgi:hypothetical protein